MLHDCIIRNLFNHYTSQRHTNTYTHDVIAFLSLGACNSENAAPKVSSFQETFCGFAVGNVIPNGTPVVLVVELESALTAVGYAKTAFDIVHSQSSLHCRHNHVCLQCDGPIWKLMFVADDMLTASMQTCTDLKAWSHIYLASQASHSFVIDTCLYYLAGSTREVRPCSSGAYSH